MRVALVTDYLNQVGGAERVMGALHRLFPDAPIYTTIADPAVVDSFLRGADVRTSWMQRLPGIGRHYRKYFLLYPLAVESFDLRRYDLVVSNSSAYAKSVITRPDACHICYCHTPMRFAWNFAGYAAREGWGSVTRRVIAALVEPLRRWDRRTAIRPSIFVANSTVGAERIRRHYGRTAAVVFPPVEVDRFAPSDRDDGYYLIVSRLVAYKRLDLAVAAFNRLGRSLVIVGDGPARADLERAAGPSIRFAGRVPDAAVAEHYARCRGVVFPGEEDFGLVPLEANASGKPVVAFEAGGALDTVIPGKTGVFFSSQTAESLADAVTRCDAIEWERTVLREHAERFREEVFRGRFLTVISAAMAAAGTTAA